MISKMIAKFRKNKNMFPHCTAPFYALVITDTHGHARCGGIDEFLKRVDQIDVLFTLGDVEHMDFDAINAHPRLKGVPKYGVIGNHDYFSVLKDAGVYDIHNQVVDICGVRFVGMYGSIRYKNVDAPMFTDEESVEVAAQLPECDIFLTHDKAKVEKDDARSMVSAHSGMLGIGKYIKEKKPAYHLHGHLHENMKETVFGVSSFGFARYAYIKVDKTGLEILKMGGSGMYEK